MANSGDSSPKYLGLPSKGEGWMSIGVVAEFNLSVRDITKPNRKVYNLMVNLTQGLEVPIVRRMPFERPTIHYDERIVPVDEQICALIKKRKDISNNNPGYPPFEMISSWSEKFGLYEDFLKSLFENLRNEEHYRPRTEPAVFRRHLPVLKSVEKDDEMFTVTFIRQFDNASVVNLSVDSIPDDQDREHPPQRHRFLELSLGDGYECRSSGGTGSQDHHTYQFVVTPPLPDNASDLLLVFQEYNSPFGEPTGFKLYIPLR